MKRVLSFLLAIVMLFSMFAGLSVTSSAASNPYDRYAKDANGNWANCTWWAWQLAYDNTGVALPGWGNAGTWYNRAVNAGYSCGSTPAVNSIAVRSNGSYGHVQFVTAVSGSQIYVKEGGYRGTSNGYHEGWTMTSGVIGYIYCSNKPTNATISVNKTVADINEAVTFTFSASGATAYAIGINRNGTRIITEYVNSGKSYSFSQEGNYTAYVTAYNGSGDIDSNVVSFYVRNIQNLGDNFIAYIIHNKSGCAVLPKNDNVMVNDFNKANTQKWLFSRQSDCSYKISSVSESGKCLDVAGAGSANYTNIQIVNSNDSNAQRWFICKNGSGYSFVSKCAPSKAFDLDANVTGDKSNIHLWDYTADATTQIFSFRMESGAYYTKKYNGKEYRLYNVDIPWNEAYKYCEQLGGHLVTIGSEEEQKFVSDFAKEYSTNARIWLGASDLFTEGKWNWITGESFNYKNWGEGEPNNDHDEDYLMMGKSGKWNDTRVGKDTTNKYSFICEFENATNTSNYTPVKILNNGNHFYEVYTNNIDWQTAKRICSAKGGHLVTIESSSENSALKSALSVFNNTRFWIGLTDIDLENQWAWISSAKATYTNWGTGEPNNDSCIEDYAALNLPNGKWNDLPGYALAGFICEYDNHTHSWNRGVITKAATCTAAGTKKFTCTVCGESKTEKIAKTAHQYKNKVIAPTAATIGYTVEKCSLCGNEKSKTTFTAPTGKLTLNHSARTNNAIKVQWNNVKTATGYQVQISTKDGKKWSTYATLKAGVTAYTFKNLAAGNNYKFRVRFYIKAEDGKNYYSPWSKTLGSPTLPSGTTLTKLSSAKKAFNAQWKKNAAVNGYQIQYGLKSNFSGSKTLTVKNAKTLKATVKKLSAKKTYYVRIRTYKTISKVNYFSSWSKAYKVKTK